MHADPLCLVCMMRQALNTARIATEDPDQHAEVLRRVAALCAKADLTANPAQLSQPVYEIVAAVTGVADPYAELKARTNREALALLPALEALVEASADPLDASLHLAVAGNIIDLGIGHDFDLERDVHALMATPFAVDAVADFRAELRPGRTLLFLGDNSGEIVFDRVLVDHLLAAGLEVTYVVKSGPIINDATRADAETAGLTARVPVIETGSADIGVNWERASAAFRAAYDRAEIILGKGHGNFETGAGLHGNRYFLLKAKCPVVAAALGIEEGRIAFHHAFGVGS